MRETLSEAYILANRTKSASRGWKVVCPQCTGKDCWVTLDNGTGFCFECGAQYAIGENKFQRPKQEVRELDVPGIRHLYDTAVDFYHDCLTPDHLEFLERRGIDRSDVDTFMIGFCPTGNSPLYHSPLAQDSGIVDYAGSPWLANRIVFPYFAEGHATDLRGRSTDGTDPKYKSLPRHAMSRGAWYPFNYERAYKLARKSKTVIVTEGEIKAIVADKFGHAAVAFPGMLSLRPGVVFDADVRIVVIYDNAAGKEDKLRVDRAIAKLSDRLGHFYVATLPLLGEEKQDIDSFLLNKRGGPVRFQQLVDEAVTYAMYKQLRKF